MVKLKVKTLTGITFHLVFGNPNATMLDLKRQLPFPPGVQVVVFQGAELTDSTSVAQAGLVDDDVLVLTFDKSRSSRASKRKEAPATDPRDAKRHMRYAPSVEKGFAFREDLLASRKERDRESAKDAWTSRHKPAGFAPAVSGAERVPLSFGAPPGYAALKPPANPRRERPGSPSERGRRIAESERRLRAAEAALVSAAAARGAHRPSSASAQRSAAAAGGDDSFGAGGASSSAAFFDEALRVVSASRHAREEAKRKRSVGGEAEAAHASRSSCPPSKHHEPAPASPAAVPAPPDPLALARPSPLAHPMLAPSAGFEDAAVRLAATLPANVWAKFLAHHPSATKATAAANAAALQGVLAPASSSSSSVEWMNELLRGELGVDEGGEEDDDDDDDEDDDCEPEPEGGDDVGDERDFEQLLSGVHRTLRAAGDAGSAASARLELALARAAGGALLTEKKTREESKARRLDALGGDEDASEAASSSEGSDGGGEAGEAGEEPNLLSEPWLLTERERAALKGESASRIAPAASSSSSSSSSSSLPPLPPSAACASGEALRGEQELAKADALLASKARPPAAAASARARGLVPSAGGRAGGGFVDAGGDGDRFDESVLQRLMHSVRAPPPARPSPDAVDTLAAMGFARGQCERALELHGNDVAMSLDWLLGGQ